MGQIRYGLSPGYAAETEQQGQHSIFQQAVPLFPECGLSLFRAGPEREVVSAKTIMGDGMLTNPVPQRWHPGETAACRDYYRVQCGLLAKREAGSSKQQPKDPVLARPNLGGPGNRFG